MASFLRVDAALLVGALRIIEASSTLLVFERSSANQHQVCVYNFSDGAVHWAPAQPYRWRMIERVNAAEDWDLPAYGGLIAKRIA